MLLNARIIKKPKRKRIVCDDCDKLITGPHLYLYGTADTGDKPHSFRIHLTCSSWKDKKIIDAYKRAGLTPHWESGEQEEY